MLTTSHRLRAYLVRAGKRIHEAHHKQAYHHVSIDEPHIVLGFMLLSAGLVFSTLPTTSTAATACVAYWATGLISYTLVHFLVHTRCARLSRPVQRG